MSVQKATDENFKKVTESQNLILIDFFGEWCSPCKALSPVLESLSEELKDKCTFYKLDIDQSPNSPTVMGIRGVPTLCLFKAGELVSQKVGFTDRENLKKWIIENSN